MALLASAALAAQAPAKAKSTATHAKSGAQGRTIQLTGLETMKYDVTQIQARPGEKLHVVLKAAGNMPKLAMAHNFVLLKANANAMDVANAAMNARDTDFIPASAKDQIIAHTALAGGGETVEVSFTAPSKPGTYTYLCTFPGHFAAGMKGELTVK